MASTPTATVDARPVAAPPSGLCHPFNAGGTVRGVLFDVDGTLYRQAPVRGLMALELLTLALTSPFRAPKCLRALASYRRAQESLRANPNGRVSARAQVAAAASCAGLSEQNVEDLIDQWMFRRPLKYLAAFRRPGLIGLLDLLDRSGVKTGVLTDYPATQKLQALGLAKRFSLVLCSTDPEIGQLKPHPQGFLRACERWALSPDDVLMVGDRVEVDAAGAAAAGMASVVIGKPARRGPLPPNCLLLPSFERLCDVLDRRS